MKKALLIFDFDGTIADTLLVAVRILNEVGQEFDLPHVDRDQFLELKHKSVPELMKMAGLPWIKLPFFINQARKKFRVHLKQVKPIMGMPEILSTLKRRGYKMGIVTSNTEEGVNAFLEAYQLKHFDFVYAPNSIFDKSKTIRSILHKYHLLPSEVTMIGDEIRDVEAANKVGIESIAVTWGFNSEQLLLKGCPNHVVKEPKELLNLLN